MNNIQTYHNHIVKAVNSDSLIPMYYIKTFGYNRLVYARLQVGRRTVALVITIVGGNIDTYLPRKRHLCHLSTVFRIIEKKSYKKLQRRSNFEIDSAPVFCHVLIHYSI